MRKKKGGMWQDLVGLTFLALLLGAAIIANVSDGPMRDHRGSWLTHASKIKPDDRKTRPILTPSLADPQARSICRTGDGP